MIFWLEKLILKKCSLIFEMMANANIDAGGVELSSIAAMWTNLQLNEC